MNKKNVPPDVPPNLLIGKSWDIGTMEHRHSVFSLTRARVKSLNPHVPLSQCPNLGITWGLVGHRVEQWDNLP